MRRRWWCWGVAGVLACTAPDAAQPTPLAPVAPFRILAAGSLAGAFNALIAQFNPPASAAAVPVYGPSGVLRERIENGEAADLFASADMSQPRRLVADGHGTPVVMFARNRICALAPATLGLTPDTVLDRLLDPALRLATSTPGADPSGDYAWAVFDRAERIHPGAKAILEGKAQKLMGGPAMAPLVPGQGPVEGIFLSGRADVLLAYCSGVDQLNRTSPGITALALPTELSVGPAYGMTVLSANPEAARFALFVVSEPGQKVLAQFGLVPVGLP